MYYNIYPEKVGLRRDKEITGRSDTETGEQTKRDLGENTEKGTEKTLKDRGWR